MLQPIELQEVSLRFANEIATLRKFFLQASVSLANAKVTHEITSRLEEDSAFHRDMMSHVWVLLDELGPTLRYADLLAMITIAAAGLHGAAQTDEDDAHALLRFLMDAKHALERKPPEGGSASAGMADAERSLGPLAAPGFVVADMASFSRSHLPVRSELGEEPRVATASVNGNVPPNARPRLVYLGAALCTLAVLVWWMVSHRQSPPTSNLADAARPASSVGETARKQGRGMQDSPLTPLVSPTLSSPTSRGVPSRSSNAAVSEKAAPPQSSGPVALVPNAVGPAAEPQPAEVASSGAGLPPADATRIVPGNVPTTSESVQHSAKIAVRPPTSAGSAVSVVSADSLSKQLDSPRFPAYASDPQEVSRRKYPRLLRRRLSDPSGESTESGSTLTAELRAPDLSPTTSSSQNGARSVALHGLVRSTCLGMMASNLLYGPAPAYPAAAAAARVQGEVKIQATVDRDGTINAARVVSGPPLLRDAALDAVQHWRYKPYTTGGKPAPTGTMAVLDFELP